MDMFQLNTFPAGGIAMKTRDFGLMSGRITIGRLRRTRVLQKFIYDSNGQVKQRERVASWSESNLWLGPG